MEQHKTFCYQGHTIHYRDEGRHQRQVLVLLHGFLQSQDVWSSYTLSFMRSMRVIAIDLPGFGYSDTYGEVHTMEFMADVVKAVLDEAEVDQCVLVGHSMGGYVALAFADKYYFRLRGLGLVNSHALSDTPEQVQLRLQACQQAQANRAGYIINFIDSLFDESKKKPLNQEIKDLQDQCLETTLPGLMAAQMGMAGREERVEVLRHLECPVLFVLGKNDPRLELEVAVSQAMEAHHVEMLLLDGVGHMSFLEERDYVKLRLKNFVETCYY